MSEKELARRRAADTVVVTFKELRAASGMTQRAYAEYFGVSLRTVESWETGHRNCPAYLLDLMRYKLEKENIIK